MCFSLRIFCVSGDRSSLEMLLRVVVVSPEMPVRVACRGPRPPVTLTRNKPWPANIADACCRDIVLTDIALSPANVACAYLTIE